ncbi:MAG: flagellar biosynthesis protein FliA [Dethiosulfovibrio peptidovorans]|nr:MAG: flagellar biosynthesis protein FliA [Dethiosulfovibrio peptidovorans]
MQKNRISPEEERALWIRHKNGNKEAREALILLYRPLVFWIAKKFHVAPGLYPDIVQEGMMALINGVDRFKPERGYRFTTYGYYRIKGQMLNFLQRKEAKAPLPMEDVDEELRAPVSPESIDAALDLWSALESLPDRECRILSELIMEGRKAKDVAKDEDLDVSHVYRLRRKALAWLKNWLVVRDATPQR